jgi:peroxiredoxin
MKNLIRLSIVCLIAFLGCAPDTPTFSDYINPHPQYSHNVSSLYALVQNSSVGMGVDVKWQDSAGLLHKLSDYRGKPVIFAFGRVSDLSSDTLYRELDSIRNDMADSVMIIAVAKDALGFATVSNFATSQNIHTQMISDSTSQIQLQFVQYADGLIYTPETFVLATTGRIDAKYVTEGREDKVTLEKYARLLMKH